MICAPIRLSKEEDPNGHSAGRLPVVDKCVPLQLTRIVVEDLGVRQVDDVAIESIGRQRNRARSRSQAGLRSSEIAMEDADRRWEAALISGGFFTPHSRPQAATERSETEPDRLQT